MIIMKISQKLRALYDLERILISDIQAIKLICNININIVTLTTDTNNCNGSRLQARGWLYKGWLQEVLFTMLSLASGSELRSHYIASY